MRLVQQATTRAAIVGEVFSFFWKQKLWWLIPLLVILLAVGVLFLIAQVSSAAPWMYPL